MLKLFQQCLGRHKAERFPDQRSISTASPSDSKVAEEILNAMESAEKSGEEVRTKVADVVGVKSNWTESLARAVLECLAKAVETGVVEKTGGALKEAFDKAVEAAKAVGLWIEKHPVLFTIIALGILVVLLPWVIEALGFAELGPIEGTFASYLPLLSLALHCLSLLSRRWIFGDKITHHVFSRSRLLRSMVAGSIPRPCA